MVSLILSNMKIPFFLKLIFVLHEASTVLTKTYNAVDKYEFPHQVRLPGCGGTVYNKDFIITAAHCVIRNGEVIDLKEVPLKAILGDNDSEDNTFGIEEIILKQFAEVDAASETIIPQKRFINDIALLKLDRSIDFIEQTTIKALKIAPPNFRPAMFADQAVVLEWNVDDILEKWNVPIQTDATCLDSNELENHDRYLCMGGTGSDSIGDSGGGPAICRGPGGLAFLCGIKSFETDNLNIESGTIRSSTCARNVFVAVSYFRNWLIQHAGVQDPISLYNVKLYGSFTPKDKYLHQVHLTTDDGQKCGGTLISQDTLVTAASCVFTDDKRMRQGVKVDTMLRDVRNGVQSENRFQDTRQAVHGINFHKDYSLENLNLTSCGRRVLRDALYVDNVAIIKLDRKVDNIRPDQLARLPPLKSFKPGMAVEVAFPLDTKRSGALMQREYIILNEEECQEKIDKFNLQLNTSLVMCGVEVYAGGSSCDRELGGGLFCKDQRGQEFLCGVQTFRLCTSSLPNLFPVVGKYMTLINILTNL